MLDFRRPPPDPSHIGRYLFGGFSRSLYAIEKFQSDPERRLAEILERDALKWFRPRRGQFQLSYRHAGESRDYQPDFVAETPEAVYMLEPKAASEMDDPVVARKKQVAEEWCGHATEHGGKPWSYALIRHDAIRSNMTLQGLVRASKTPRGETDS